MNHVDQCVLLRKRSFTLSHRRNDHVVYIPFMVVQVILPPEPVPSHPSHPGKSQSTQ